MLSFLGFDGNLGLIQKDQFGKGKISSHDKPNPLDSWSPGRWELSRAQFLEAPLGIWLPVWHFEEEIPLLNVYWKKTPRGLLQEILFYFYFKLKWDWTHPYGDILRGNVYLPSAN